VGTKAEQAGIIWHAATMLYATVLSSVVLGKAYGAGYYAMNGRAYQPDLFMAWPGAEIDVARAESALAIAADSFVTDPIVRQALDKESEYPD